MKRLVAGLDVDFQAKLFWVDDATGKTLPVWHHHWIEILEDLDAEPGELLRVKLVREQDMTDVMSET